MPDVLNFLKSVLPSKGFYCLAQPATFVDKETGEPKSYYKHYVTESIEKLAEQAVEASDKELDVYFCTGSLKEAKVWNEGTQKFQVRTHENVQYHRSLFVDLDCGEDKAFLDISGAIAALKAFCKTSGFPKPTYLVKSGGGVHAYWSFDKDLPSNIWLQFAERFKLIHKHFGFQADPAITADIARVLRVPGTNNWKTGEPRPVGILQQNSEYSVEQIQKCIKDICKTFNLKEPKKREEFPEHIKALFANSNLNYEYDADLIYANCPQMARVKEIGGPVGYGMRGAAVSIIKFTQQKDYSVLWANDDKEGTVRSQTESMIDASLTEHPNTCERFEGFNHGGCDTCKFKGLVKSPISLEKYVKQPPTAAEVIHLPEEIRPPHRDDEAPLDTFNSDIWKYQWDKNKQFYRLVYVVQEHDEESGNATVIPVFDGLMYPYELVKDKTTNKMSAKIYLKLAKEKGIYVTTDTELLYDKNNINKLLFGHGVFVESQKKQTLVSNYMTSYLKHLQSFQSSTMQCSQLGWLEDGECFVLPENTFYTDGTNRKSVISSKLSELAKNFRGRGSLEEWKEVINIYARKGYEGYAFGHLTAYGSLLLEMTSYDGAIVNMVGDSGSGKSTVLKSINSVFGVPKNYLNQIDTGNSKFAIIGFGNSICTTYDEITNIEPDELSDLCYSITQGRGKHRLNSDSSLKDNNASWKQIMTSTSNSNLAQKLASIKADSSAEALRVFEYYINVDGHKLSKSESESAFIKLEDNYGLAGPLFVEHLVKNKSAIRVELYETQKRIDEMFDIQTNERYWSAVVACTITGGNVAKRLGLNNFDTEALIAWAGTQIALMRGTLKETVKGTPDLMKEFINTHQDETVFQDEFGAMVIPRAKIHARYDHSAGLYWVDKSYLRQWVSRNKGDWKKFIMGLVDSGAVADNGSRYTLTKGTGRPGVSVVCIGLNVAHTSLAGLRFEEIIGDKRTGTDG